MFIITTLEWHRPEDKLPKSGEYVLYCREFDFPVVTSA